MGGGDVGLMCADPGARTPIGLSGNSLSSFFLSSGLSALNRLGLWLAETSKVSLLISCGELTVWGELDRAKCKHFPNELWRCQANIVTTKLLFFEKIWRMLARGLKLYRGFALTKKIGDPPPWGHYRFFQKKIKSYQQKCGHFSSCMQTNRKIMKIVAPVICSASEHFTQTKIRLKS